MIPKGAAAAAAGSVDSSKTWQTTTVPLAVNQTARCVVEEGSEMVECRPKRVEYVIHDIRFQGPTKAPSSPHALLARNAAHSQLHSRFTISARLCAFHVAWLCNHESSREY